MSYNKSDEQNGWLTLILGVFGGLALGFLGKKIVTGLEEPDELTEEEEEILAELEAEAALAVENPLEEKARQVKQQADTIAPDKPAVNTAIINTNSNNPATPTSLVVIKNNQPDKPSSPVSIVRRTSFIAFKGEDFQLETGKYRCMLDFFDTYYFQYIGDGFTPQGAQLFKFKAKKRLSQKAEIRFKLTDSCYSRLIYQVMIVDTVDPSKMTDDEPEDE